MTDELRTHRMAGCASFGKCLLVAGAVVLAASVFHVLNLGCRFPPDQYNRLQAKSVIADIKSGLTSYDVDHNRYPVQADDLAIKDVSMRSRGTLLKVLIGEYVPAFNQCGREVIYAEFKIAKNRKDGLWQDGTEWVLSDHWGEPFYIILDTNKDGVIGDPEVVEEHLSAILPQRVLIYSSGPDRDPKTWQDNVCSWRTR